MKRPDWEDIITIEGEPDARIFIAEYNEKIYADFSCGVALICRAEGNSRQEVRQELIKKIENMKLSMQQQIEKIKEL